MGNIIGKVAATEKAPTNIDYFHFWCAHDLILHPFDVISVEHVRGSKTFGMVEDISHITDSPSFLTDYISNDFGDVKASSNTERINMNYVRAKVVANTKGIFIPVLNGAKVMLASENEIEEALGLKDVKNPLVCGYLEMYESVDEAQKVRLPVKVNSKFLLGSEGAHLNISGISGLAAKTSYAMFLLKSIQDTKFQEEADNDIAFIMVNVKGKDLLAIDQENDEFSENEKAEVVSEYEMLGLSPKPVTNVKYYYPYSKSTASYSNTYASKEHIEFQKNLRQAFFYKFLYSEDKDNLELMFSNIDDPTQTMDAIINYIMHGHGRFGSITTWHQFLEEVENNCKAGANTEKEITVSSWRKFRRIVKRSIHNNPIFAQNANRDEGEIRLEDTIKEIKKGDIYVVDIAKLDDGMQSFVFGDIMRGVRNLKLGEYDEELQGRDYSIPNKIVIFVDELNKYASSDVPKNSPILRQIIDIAERGRSLGIVLFAAEQFRSSIHDRVKGNCSTHAYGRTNAIEISKRDYSFVPNVYQNMMTRLKQGEYIVQNPVFRSLISIKFPRPIYKQFK